MKQEDEEEENHDNDNITQEENKKKKKKKKQMNNKERIELIRTAKYPDKIKYLIVHSEQHRPTKKVTFQRTQ